MTRIDGQSANPIGMKLGCLSLQHESRGFVVILNAEGSITYANLEALRGFGVPLELAIGTSLFSYVHPEDRQEAVGKYLMLCNTLDGTVTQTLRFESKASGEVREVDVQMLNRINHSVLHGIVMNGLDVTKRNHFRADLYQNLTIWGRCRGGSSPALRPSVSSAPSSGCVRGSGHS